MAQLAAMTRLVEELTKSNLTRVHAWIDEKHGLVTGEYPQAIAWFDFNTEKLIPLNAERLEPNLKEFMYRLDCGERVTHRIDIETDRTIYRVGSFTQLLVQGLEIIEELAPGTHKMLAEDPSLKKRSKRFIAQTHAELYGSPRPPKYSWKLTTGYFVATNNKAHEAKDYLRQAATKAGLRWGENFTVRPVAKRAQESAAVR